MSAKSRILDFKFVIAIFLAGVLFVSQPAYAHFTGTILEWYDNFGMATGKGPTTLCFKLSKEINDNPTWKGWILAAIDKWNKVKDKTGWEFVECPENYVDKQTLQNLPVKDRKDVKVADISFRFAREGEKVPSNSATTSPIVDNAALYRLEIIIVQDISGKDINGKKPSGGNQGWDISGDTTLDPVLVITHELTHTMRLDHPLSAADTGNFEDPIGVGNHNNPPGRAPSASDISEAKKAADDSKKPKKEDSKEVGQIPGTLIIKDQIQTASLTITNDGDEQVSTIYIDFDQGVVRWLGAEGWDRERLDEETVLLTSGEGLGPGESIDVLLRWDDIGMPDLGSGEVPDYPLMILGPHGLDFSEFGLEKTLELPPGDSIIKLDLKCDSGADDCFGIFDSLWLTAEGNCILNGLIADGEQIDLPPIPLPPNREVDITGTAGISGVEDSLTDTMIDTMTDTMSDTMSVESVGRIRGDGDTCGVTDTAGVADCVIDSIEIDGHDVMMHPMPFYDLPLDIPKQVGMSELRFSDNVSFLITLKQPGTIHLTFEGEKPRGTTISINVTPAEEEFELSDDTIIYGAVAVWAQQYAFEWLLQILNHNAELFDGLADSYWDAYSESKDKNLAGNATMLDQMSASAKGDAKTAAQILQVAKTINEEFFYVARGSGFDTAQLEREALAELGAITNVHKIQSFDELRSAGDDAREAIRLEHKEIQNVAFGIDTSLTSGILGTSSNEFWQAACNDNTPASNIPHFELLTGFGSSNFEKICKGIDMIYSLEESEDVISDILKESGIEITASTTPPSNQAPSIGSISATLNPPNTFYSVTATDPDGDTLSFVWTNSNSCGSFTYSGNQATWSHPHPPCGEETYHPSTITVIVNDGHGHEVTRTYDKGSQDSTAVGQQSPTITPSATSISATHIVGGSPCPQNMGAITFQTSAGAGPVTLVSASAWASVSISGNTATVYFTCSNFAFGTNSGTIIFSTTANGQTATASVSATIVVT